MSASRYQAGVCNIGGRERRRRAQYAAFAFLLAGAYLIVVVASSLPAVLLVGLFVPFTIGTEMALQARRSFCVSYALSGKYVFDEESGRVSDPDARRADRNRGITYLLAGLGVGAVGTVVTYLLVVTL